MPALGCSNTPLLSRISPAYKAADKSCLPWTGCIRLASTAATGYSVDASEYGKHWNFFFTLAALELLTLAAPQQALAAGASGELLCTKIMRVNTKHPSQPAIHRGCRMLPNG